MDAGIVRKLHDVFKVALDDPKAQELMAKYDYPKRYMNTDDYVKFVQQQVAEQKEIVEKLGLARKQS
jgi:tripartite-type tricarboxylate transporter receptor subunit TctC